MKKTRVIRADEEFISLLENGRRLLQAATGRKITTLGYTSELARIMKPFSDVNSENMYIKKKK